MQLVFLTITGHPPCFARIGHAQNKKGGVVISLSLANRIFDGDRLGAMQVPWDNLWLSPFNKQDWLSACGYYNITCLKYLQEKEGRGQGPPIYNTS